MPFATNQSQNFFIMKCRIFRFMRPVLRKLALLRNILLVQRHGLAAFSSLRFHRSLDLRFLVAGTPVREYSRQTFVRCRHLHANRRNAGRACAGTCPCDRAARRLNDLLGAEDGGEVPTA